MIFFLVYTQKHANKYTYALYITYVNLEFKEKSLQSDSSYTTASFLSVQEPGQLISVRQLLT